MNYLKGVHNLRKVVGVRKTSGYLWRFSKKMWALKEGQYGSDPSLIKAADACFKDIVAKYVNKTPSSSPINKEMFLLWWTGWDKVPPIVAAAKASLLKNYPDYRIHFLAQDNIEQFIEKDNPVYQLFLHKKIAVQMFSDYLRFYLLKKYGGYWVDATLFFTKRFDLDFLLEGKDFSSLYYASLAKWFYYEGLSAKWADFFFASRPGSVVASCFVECLESYFAGHSPNYDYFMMDSLLFYFLIQGVGQGEIDRIPPLSGNCEYACLDLGYDKPATEVAKREVDKIPQKLNWRQKYDPKKKDSIMAYLLSSLTK
jgi:hypothetical protein